MYMSIIKCQFILRDWLPWLWGLKSQGAVVVTVISLAVECLPQRATVFFLLRLSINWMRPTYIMENYLLLFKGYQFKC